MNAFQFFVVAVADVRLHFRHSTTVKRFDCFDGKDDGGERRRLAMATTMERDELYLRVHMSIELRNLFFFSLFLLPFAMVDGLGQHVHGSVQSSCVHRAFHINIRCDSIILYMYILFFCFGFRFGFGAIT